MKLKSLILALLLCVWCSSHVTTQKGAGIGAGGGAVRWYYW